jgi:tetratricopeptide (TPR) repeat protein
MIQEFELPEPRFTSDPLGFLAAQLRGELPKEDLAETDDTLYSLGQIVAQIERAGAAIDELDPIDSDSGERQLDEIRAVIRTAQYSEAIQLGQSLVEANLSDNQKEELINRVFSSAQSLSDDSSDKQNAYDLISKVGAEIKEPPPEVRTIMARALFNKGYRVGQLDRGEEAIEVYDQLIERHSDDEVPGVRVQVAMAFVSKGFRLGELGRSEEEIEVYDELTERSSDDEEPGVRVRVARAFLNKGITLGDLGRGEEEIAVYDELIERSSNDKEPEVRVRVARAFRNKGIKLRVLGRDEQEIAVYDELIERYSDDEEPGVQEQVEWARQRKAEMED